MQANNFDSLREATDALAERGFKENFKAEENSIIALYSKKNYSPEQLKITESYRFEGMTNPDDQTELFAIEATDGVKGTLVMSYSAEHSQNVELIKAIPQTAS